jgi:hypothetical protein
MTEKKRWRLARVAVWTGILGGVVLFWFTAGAALLAWWR